MAKLPTDTELDCLRAIADGIQRLAALGEAILAERQQTASAAETLQRRAGWLGDDPPAR